MTAGPWNVANTAGHDKHGQRVVYDETSGKDVAIVYDGEADAKLIAAAPELLAALAGLVSSLDKFGLQLTKDDGLLDAAWTVMRKARGEYV